MKKARRYVVVPVDAIERVGAAVRLTANDVPRAKLEGVHGAIEDLASAARAPFTNQTAHALAEKMAEDILENPVLRARSGAARAAVIATVLPYCMNADLTEETLEAARLHIGELREMLTMAESVLKARCFQDRLAEKAPDVKLTSTVKEAYDTWVLHHPDELGATRSFEDLSLGERRLWRMIAELQEIEGAHALNENALRLVRLDINELLTLPHGTSLHAARTALRERLSALPPVALPPPVDRPGAEPFENLEQLAPPPQAITARTIAKVLQAAWTPEALNLEGEARAAEDYGYRWDDLPAAEKKEAIRVERERLEEQIKSVSIWLTRVSANTPAPKEVP